MTRNVTDAAVVLGAITGIDPDDPRPPPRAATRSTTTPRTWRRTRSTGRGSASGGRAPTIRRSSPVIDEIMDDAVAQLRRSARRSSTRSRSRSRTRTARSSRAAVRVQARTSPAYFETYTGGGYPRRSRTSSTSTRRTRTSRGRGTRTLFEWREATGAREDPACAAARGTPTRSRGVDRRHDGGARPRRDHCARPTARPGSPTQSTATASRASSVVDPGGDAGYPDITVPAGYEGPFRSAFVHGGRLVRARAARVRYAFEQATMIREPPSTSRRSARTPGGEKGRSAKARAGG